MSPLLPADLPYDIDAALEGLSSLGRHLATLHGLDVSPLVGCDGEAMLVVEGPDFEGQSPTWLVTAAAGRPMMLEAVVDETRLELLAIAPADRILALLGALARRVRIDA